MSWNRLKIMVKSVSIQALAVLLFVGWPALVTAEQATPKHPDVPAEQERGVPQELTDPKYLYEIVRQVYRWHLDENDVDRLVGATNFTFWVRRVGSPMDKGDNSQVAEIVMPLVGTAVKVKKPDYRIEELDISVTGGLFRITNVSKIGIPDEPLPAHQVINVSYAEMRDFLFKTRWEATFPDKALFERLRVALRTQLGLQPAARTTGRHIAHLAPLSPVSNEVWVYLETQNLLIRFASDIELVNPAVWEHESLMVKTWNVKTQVVISLDEAAGSNAFMTRDQIGRALYNCVVLGQRLELNNSEADTPSQSRD